MLDSYRAGVSEGERLEFEEWFGVAGKAAVPAASAAQTNQALPTSEASHHCHAIAAATADLPEAVPAKHIVSATLFWKHVNAADPDLPPPTREMLVDAKRMGLVKRFAPWSSYIEPLLVHSRAAMERHPHVTFRLYLAADLDFLIPELTDLGWEICLMKSPSIRYSPGGFWRFLALEDEALVTVIDTDRMGEVSQEIARTEGMHQMGLGLWRVPGYYNSDLTQQVRYRPILGGPSGVRGPETYYWRVDSHGLAVRCQKAMEKVSPAEHSNRGMVRRRLRLTRNPEIPCLLLEFGYLSHPTEATLLQSADYRQKMAVAVANALREQSARGDAGTGPLPPPLYAPLSRPTDAPE